MKLSRDEAEEVLDGSRGEIIADNITSHGRWSVHHRIIVLLDGKYYSTTYSRGATEYQDEDPFGYSAVVEFTEVEPKQITVTQYFPIAVAIEEAK